MTVPIRELEANVTESMRIEGARVLKTALELRGLSQRDHEILSAKLYAHMEDVRRRNEENSKRRRNFGYAD